MLKRLEKDTSGIASMITVLFVSIVLSIIVLGFIRVAVNEQRQAADDDLTTRAFYAAESGIEDAKRAIIQELGDTTDSFALNEDDCDPPSGYSGVISPEDGFDVEYTCMLIDMTPPDYQAELDEGESVVIELIPEPGETYNRIELQWHLKGNILDGADGPASVLRPAGSTDLPTQANWDADTPAMLRAYLYSHDDSFNRAELRTYTTLAFLDPTDSSSPSPINHNPNGGAPAAPNEPLNMGIVSAECDNSVTDGEYVCRREYTIDSSGLNHYLRLTSLYKSTHIRVILYTGNPVANPVDFASGQQVLVDVTGRAADVFRRVEARLDLEAGLEDYIPDYGIFSADDLCKNMSVTDSSYIDNCP